MLDVHQPRLSSVNIPPPLGTKDVRPIKQWVDSGLYYAHDLRVRDASGWRKAELYDRGAQWLQQALAGYEGGTNLAQWVEIYWSGGDAGIPTPVFNEGVGGRINESARLGRPNYRPNVTPKSESPDLRSREGAKLMKEMLEHRLKETHWDDKHGPLLYYHMPLYGGAWWKSEFVLRWDQTVTVPVLDAVQCLQCQQILASPKLNTNSVNRLAMAGPVSEGALTLGRSETGEPEHGVNGCPWCPDHAPMAPYKPTLEEAQNGAKDALGRSLGQEQPMGDWEMTIRSPYDMFPRNMGLDTIPGEVREWSEAHVEHLDDWVGLRWPDKVGNVSAENPAALARYHPVAGAPDMLYSLLDARMFENCVRVKERHKLPWMEPIQNEATGEYEMRLNQGRSAVVIGEQVMFYGPLLMKSANYPGEYVERSMVDYIPWEFIDGGRRLQGQGLWNMMFDPQDIRNTIASQTASVRERLAVPMYVALTTHNFQIQAMRGGIPGSLIEIEPDPTAPNVLPQLINNTTIDPGTRAESQDAINACKDYAGYAEVEKGNPPPGVSAGYAIEALKGAAGERREPRLNRVKASLKRAWGHGARVITHMYAEGRPVKYEDDDGEERWRYTKGLDFAKQTDVEVEGEPDFDSGAQQVEKIRDAIMNHVIDPVNATPSKQRKIARMLKLPEELFEDEDEQEKEAQREWIALKEEQRVPRIDPGIDDNSTHYEEHGRACHSAYFRDMERRAGWDDALALLGGQWFQSLKQIAFIPGPPDLQDRILNYWSGTLAQFGFAAPPAEAGEGPSSEEALRFVLTWRAHIEAHRLEDEMKQMRAMTAPELASPGAPTTAAGNQPTEVAPPEEQVGMPPPPMPAQPAPPEPAAP